MQKSQSHIEQPKCNQLVPGTSAILCLSSSPFESPQPVSPRWLSLPQSLSLYPPGWVTTSSFTEDLSQNTSLVTPLIFGQELIQISQRNFKASICRWGCVSYSTNSHPLQWFQIPWFVTASQISASSLVLSAGFRHIYPLLFTMSTWISILRIPKAQ